MPRLSVPLTPQQHTAIKVKAAQVGLAQAEVARRLLFAWEEGEIALPDESQDDLDDYEFASGPGHFGAFPKKVKNDK